MLIYMLSPCKENTKSAAIGCADVPNEVTAPIFKYVIAERLRGFCVVVSWIRRCVRVRESQWGFGGIKTPPWRVH